MSFWDAIRKVLPKWDGRLFIARRRESETCPKCGETFVCKSGFPSAVFCDRPRAEAKSDEPVLDCFLNTPEIAPTVLGREETAT